MIPRPGTNTSIKRQQAKVQAIHTFLSNDEKCLQFRVKIVAVKSDLRFCIQLPQFRKFSFEPVCSLIGHACLPAANDKEASESCAACFGAYDACWSGPKSLVVNRRWGLLA